MNATNTTCTFTIKDCKEVKKKMLNWANRFSIYCFLDNHHYRFQPHSVDCILAAGVKRKISVASGSALPLLQSFLEEKKPRLFGHLGYELETGAGITTGGKPDYLMFPDLFFFEPAITVFLNENSLAIEGENADKIFRQIMNEPVISAGHHTAPVIQQRIKKQEYLEIISALRNHILRGDCYEINFCQEFFSENAVIDPVKAYEKLSDLSPNPFSALYKLEDKWLLCASPERFLKKTGTRIISQPIKGTSSRILHDEVRDQKEKDALFSSKKDRSENVMVVDLVRNDLSQVCTEGSVKVDELYGIYSFPQVHQMISTISGELKTGTPFTHIIRAAFPMGSMTGAPKKKVMELIARYEKSKRGIFSGALGYITPDGDFDFNVVIRSIMYNATEKYLSFQAGSGITFYSDAEKEYEECLLKAEAMKKALTD